ncbi:DUF427 domain-containing protein [Paraburkholderia bonniea]|uniref:DUF427 domain-containing protein n=1 Tax=Paraburkholderia bonniea TaxID=2152891 RepID=UPI0012929A6E|nr:DUF427 domain-containing protein [Paraburkholderia bonniea]WJF89713.1 DUF427 domain-containing protein [Paraburkholderia bonniea]WJF93027.1 DUF427 domain-containing protein [Paraburkholderia bonniea]
MKPASVSEPDPAAAGAAEPPAGTQPAGARINITANRHRVRVIHHGVTIADSLAALTLAETGLPDVIYFPRADVNMARLERSLHTSHCPYKGMAAYFHLRTEEGWVENAVWSYEQPAIEAEPVKGYLAFYAAQVDRIDQTS